MLRDENGIKEKYETYEKRRIASIIKEIPPERRRQLVEEIQYKASIMGCSNGNALKAALKLLRKEEGNGAPTRK